MEQREIRPHTHDGPRTDQTDDDQFIMTCERCGVKFMNGMEDMGPEDIRTMMDIINPQEQS